MSHRQLISARRRSRAGWRGPWWYRGVGVAVLLCEMTMAPLSVSGATEEQSADRIELQAAYCEPVLQNDLRLLQQMLDTTDAGLAHPDDLPAQVREQILTALRKTQEELPKAIAARHAALDRLQAFLAPRLKHLDVHAVSSAQGRAQADIEEMSAASTKCAVQCEEPHGGMTPEECSNRCVPKELRERLNRCRTPSWLPGL